MHTFPGGIKPAIVIFHGKPLKVTHFLVEKKCQGEWTTNICGGFKRKIKLTVSAETLYKKVILYISLHTCK